MARVPPQRAVIKTATTQDESMCLRREYNNYQVPEIAACPHIRALCDTIRSDNSPADPSCLVFEWMDYDLRSIIAPELRSRPVLPKIMSSAVLSALAVLKSVKGVHTNVNSNNTYLSDVDGNDPVAKLGDLGNLMEDGSIKQRCQSLPCRAPEVWQGQSCRHASDIWSLGSTLTTAVSAIPLFGAGDEIIKGETEAWCIAKIVRLVGPVVHPKKDHPYKKEFERAEELAVMDHPRGPAMKLITRMNWREELENIPDPPVPSDLLDFIESMLTIDPERRPTASELLMHPYVRSGGQ